MLTKKLGTGAAYVMDCSFSQASKLGQQLKLITC